MILNNLVCECGQMVPQKPRKRYRVCPCGKSCDGTLTCLQRCAGLDGTGKSRTWTRFPKISHAGKTLILVYGVLFTSSGDLFWNKLSEPCTALHTLTFTNGTWRVPPLATAPYHARTCFPSLYMNRSFMDGFVSSIADSPWLLATTSSQPSL